LVISNVLFIGFAFIAAAAAYRWRNFLLAPLRRFDARNAARIREQQESRGDPNAHFRETLRLAEEQVEEIFETPDSDPLKRFYFDGKEFDNREDAEDARREKIIEKARGYYIELDTIYLGRR
jgi:hypothetical protein